MPTLNKGQESTKNDEYLGCKGISNELGHERDGEGMLYFLAQHEDKEGFLFTFSETANNMEEIFCDNTRNTLMTQLCTWLVGKITQNISFHCARKKNYHKPRIAKYCYIRTFQRSSFLKMHKIKQVLKAYQSIMKRNNRVKKRIKSNFHFIKFLI